MPKKGYKQSPEHLEKNRQARLNKHPSEETRQKMRDAKLGARNHNYGKSMSDAAKEKLSVAMSGENNPNTGKPRPEHVRKAIGDAHRGNKNKFFGKSLPDDIKEKIRAATSGEKNHNFGKKHSAEMREKLAIPHIGLHPSEETKIKMHEAQKGEKAHAWRGGISFEPYCPKFTKEFKERVRAFFGYKCQICGHVWQEGERLLAVHHVNYNKNTCCNDDIPLFVPLCFQPCHTKTNHNREMWLEYFTDRIKNEYGGKCYYSFEEMRKKKCGV